MFLTFEGIENVRDLGGLTRADGAQVRRGVLLRSGKLSDATEGDLKRLADMGLRTVLDFRDPAECRRHPDRAVPGAVNRNLPALPDLGKHFRPPDDPTYTAREIHEDFHSIYRYLAVSMESQSAYASFFDALLASEGAPVLWHCTQGKDRTGVAAILLLTALGFDEDTILAEYMLTNEYMQRQLDAFEAAGETPEQMAVAREVFLVYEENARYYMRCVQLEYGTLPQYIELALGVGPRQIETLERYYLT